MNPDKLIGLTVSKAKILAKKAGWIPEVYDEGTIFPAITLPKNVVRIIKDAAEIVTDAETQKSIDAKYAKKN